MRFLWPELLFLLLLVPLVAFGYRAALRRKSKAALRYPSVAMLRDAIGTSRQLRRHIPPLLLLCGITTLILAIGRPATALLLPSRFETIILAIDVSGSMRAADVSPDRMKAARAAAKSFVQRQPRTARIGIVAFSTTASLVQPPTHGREDILSAIDRLEPLRSTATGTAILVSLQAIFPHMKVKLSGRAGTRAGWAPFDVEPFSPVPPGSHRSAVIVLLTDGRTTSGVDPIGAAQIAAQKGVRVYTVGVGTEQGIVVTGAGWTMRVSLDQETLKRIADITRAEYFYANAGPELQRVYETLTSRFVLEKKEREVTALFTAIGSAFVLTAGLLSLIWFGRPV